MLLAFLNNNLFEENDTLHWKLQRFHQHKNTKYCTWPGLIAQYTSSAIPDANRIFAVVT